MYFFSYNFASFHKEHKSLYKTKLKYMIKTYMFVILKICYVIEIFKPLPYVFLQFIQYHSKKL